MSNYVRVKLLGGCYFFTLVTFGRYKFLTSEPARGITKIQKQSVLMECCAQGKRVCPVRDNISIATMPHPSTQAPLGAK